MRPPARPELRVPSGLIGRPLVRALVAYIVVGAALSAGAAAMDRLAGEGRGIPLTVTAHEAGGDRVVLQTTTPRLDLTFLDRDPSLPGRYISAKWRGYWYRAADELVDLRLGADDRAELLVDGQSVIRRDPRVGMGPITAPLWLARGVHVIELDYGQDGGGHALVLEVAPSGRAPAAIDPAELFDDVPTPQAARRVAHVAWLRSARTIAWVLPPVAWVLVIVLRAGVSALRRDAERGTHSGAPVVNRSTRLALLTIFIVAAALRLLLALRAPVPFGYVYDPYYEPVEMLYRTGHLPESAACWQCYHPPLFYWAGWPFFAAGMFLHGHQAYAARAELSLLGTLCAGVCLFYAYRLFRFFDLNGRELVVATGLVAALPVAFFASYGAEADTVLAAVAGAFLFALVRYDRDFAGARWPRAAWLGALAGLAMATKYSGLAALAAALAMLGIRFITRSSPAKVLAHAVIVVIVAGAIGSWKYVDNEQRYGTFLFANGSAQDGFAFRRPAFLDRYDFTTFRLGDLVALTRPDAPKAALSYIPVYRSVWTTLYGMAWGDMGFFSEPSRGGIDQVYGWRGVPPWLASSVLLLGVIPTGVAAIGMLVALARRSFLAVHVLTAITLAAYFYWVLSQSAWALKTKYLLFLVPVYALYAAFGVRWIRARVPLLGAVCVRSIFAVLIVTHAYLFVFALGWTTR